MGTFENYTPTIEELTKKPPFNCTQADCSSSFQNSGNLHLHLLKHHKIGSITKFSPNTHFFCPELRCKYNMISSSSLKFFLSKRLLKQHYAKVHAVKSVNCPKCSQMFANTSLRNVHQKNCGQEFKCSECSWTYGSRMALLTHCRRKKHAMTTKVTVQSDVLTTQSMTSISVDSKSMFILPKVEVDNLKKCQTTQTAHDVTSSTESSMTKQFLDTWNDRASCVSSKEQQTATVPIKEAFTNIDFFDTESNNLITNTSSQTDRNLNNLKFNDKDCSMNYFGNTPFDTSLCHSETQTEFDRLIGRQVGRDSATNDDQLDPMIHNHIHTQTCDEILSEFGLSNMQTQTTWPPNDYSEILVSTETQTNRDSTPNVDQLDPVMYNHMHTQTCDEILSEFGLSNMPQSHTTWPSNDYSDLLVSTETQTSFSACLLENPSTYTQTGDCYAKLFREFDMSSSSNSQSTCTQTAFASVNIQTE